MAGKWVYLVSPTRNMDEGDEACFPDTGSRAWNRAIDYLHQVAEDRDQDEDYSITLAHRLASACACRYCDEEACPSRVAEYVG